MATTIEDLPGVCFSQILDHLPPKDRAVAASVCRQWHAPAAAPEYWHDACKKTWLRWGGAVPAGVLANPHHPDWQATYSKRVALDRQAEACLAEMRWPLRRMAALGRLQELGEDALDCLAAAASASGPERLGRRYWGALALGRVGSATAAAKMRAWAEVAAQQGDACVDLERGAIFIAEAHYPTRTFGGISAYLDRFAAELRRRTGDDDSSDDVVRSAPHTAATTNVANNDANSAGATAPAPAGGGSGSDSHAAAPSTTAAAAAAAAEPAGAVAGAPPGPSPQAPMQPPPPPLVMDPRAALGALRQLLFGEPPLGMLPGAWQDTESDEVTAPQGLFDALPAPAGGAGLGLKGNDATYYDPRNSLICDVLARGLGIPISLAVVHAAVGRRAGLPIQCISMPMHFINRLPRAATEADPWQATYIDVFNGGAQMERAELQALMATLEVPREARLLAPVDAPTLYVRMLYNLMTIYRQQRNYEKLRIVLAMLRALRPQSKEFALLHAQLCLQLEAYDEAAAVLERVAAQGAGEGDDAAGAAAVSSYLTIARAHNTALQEQCTRQLRRSEHPSVLHRVGAVFLHRRYAYRGVITGWDVKCEADDEWISRMGVDRLPGGRSQPFYKVLVDVRDRPGMEATYVAQENVEPVGDDVIGDGIHHRDIGHHFEALQPPGSGSGVGGSGSDGSAPMDADAGGCGEGSSEAAAAPQRRMRYVPNAFLRYKYPEDY